MQFMLKWSQLECPINCQILLFKHLLVWDGDGGSGIHVEFLQLLDNQIAVKKH